MQIDLQNGTVTLPNGVAIEPGLTQDDFRASAMFAQVRNQRAGAGHWMNHDFPGGQLDGKELLVSLCFYDQILVSVDVTADLYPPGPRDWSNYSLDVEAATKEFHDRLLEQMLGKPTRSDRFSSVDLSSRQATLAQPKTWELTWARCSQHTTPGAAGRSS